MKHDKIKLGRKNSKNKIYYSKYEMYINALFAILEGKGRKDFERWKT